LNEQALCDASLKFIFLEVAVVQMIIQLTGGVNIHHHHQQQQTTTTD
jgi:hypothetical protein